MEKGHHKVWHTVREYATHWSIAGAILAVTGAAPDHWLAELWREVPIPRESVPFWLAHVDYRLVAVIAGLSIIVGDTLWRRHGHSEQAAITSPPQADPSETADVPPLPDAPSIAVMPFANLSGDPAQEYFSDGITEDIITELSRFQALFVIARNSTFTYKDKPADVRQVARELGVRYVLEGSARKSGNRARVSAQLVDARTGNHLWAEHFDRTLDDVFDLQEEVTRGIVSAVAPELELAEVAHARHASPNDTSLRLTWRAQGLMTDGVHKGDAALVLEAIATADRAIAADPASLAAYNILAWANWSCQLYRWGPEPAKALDAMTAAVERMARLNPLDHRTLTISGVLRVVKGEHDRGIADLQRALEVNPNSSQSLMWLALCEAMTGRDGDARTHAELSLRLNPRDAWIGVAHVALALVHFNAREYAEAARMAELAIQSEPAVPLRRAIMIACCAQLGDQARAARELAVLNGFAPDFIASLLRGDFQVFREPEAMTNMLDSLRLAGAAGPAAPAPA
jgi:TolB-like protein/protein involved in temperature-dependent protein secretion